MLCRLEKHIEIPVTFNGMTSANGRAYYDQQQIKLSTAIFNENESYWTAVAVHEACHFFCKRWSRNYGIKHITHGDKFHEFEVRHLSLFGMRPIYKKAYWKYLIDEETEEILWTTWNLRPHPG